MKVLDVYDVRGRGLAALVDAKGVPIDGLMVGCLVHQGGRSWKIVGVAMMNPPSSDPNKVELVLRGDGEPDPNEELEL